MQKKYKEWVICKECGKKFKQITASHLKYKHNMTTKEYRRKYPNANFKSKDAVAFLGEKRPEHAEKMKKEREVRICEGCGKKFKVLPSSPKKYCSNECYINNANPMDNPESRAKISEANTGSRPPSFSKKLSEAFSGTKKSEQMKRKLSKTKKKQWQDPKFRRKMMKSQEKMKKKLRQKAKNDPKFKEHLIKASKKGLKAAMDKPTSPEQEFMDICDKYNLPYKYVGNGNFWIGNNPSMNPDFIHKDKNIVIEVLGDYWHTEDEFEKRKKRFTEYGWKCIGIWGHELRDLSAEDVIGLIEKKG